MAKPVIRSTLKNIHTLLIANRGEIAVRLIRSARELGLRTVAIYAADDADALHVRMADQAIALPGTGASAYLNQTAVLQAAAESASDGLHPGYGFLSENAAFARACKQAGVRFVGPSPELLALFGDKVQARRAAQQSGTPILAGSDGAVSLDQAKDFFASLPAGQAMVIKALSGGGGRGMRVVMNEDQLANAYARCQSEARGAFGDERVYVEQYLPRARHIEIQIIGDGAAVSALGERDCSIQRRHQKVLEIAPAPGLPDALRQRITDAAVRVAAQAGYQGLGTFEFLVDCSAPLDGDTPFAFMEANPRLQVEHTITEAVYGVDLVALSLQVADGRTLADLDIASFRPRGTAIQARINQERLLPDGTTGPSSGRLLAFDVPGGPGVRVDSYVFPGLTTSERYDSLLAKLICWHQDGYGAALRRTYRALCEFRLQGVDTNLLLLQNLLQHPDLTTGALYTAWLDEQLEPLSQPASHPQHHAPPLVPPTGNQSQTVDPNDWVSILTYGEASRGDLGRRLAGHRQREDGAEPVAATMRGVLLTLEVQAKDRVRAGQLLAVLESMKMEHEIRAASDGEIVALAAQPGDQVSEGQPLMFVLADTAEETVQP